MSSHRRLALSTRRLLVSLAALWLFSLTAYPAEPRRSFDIAAGNAEAALRQFSSQAGVDVVFGTATTAAVRTNPVAGSFTAAEAMDRLLAGTPLVAARSATTGAFSVTSAPKNAEATPAGPVAVSTAPALEADETIKLSPFTVVEQTGWSATETLSGTRLKTDIRDVASQLEPFTKDFMNDFALNPIEEMLPYSINADGLEEYTQDSC